MPLYSFWYCIFSMNSFNRVFTSLGISCYEMIATLLAQPYFVGLP